jgi:hypothetical protein
MNRIVILLLILSANVFSQNNFKEKFEKIKNDILINNINLEKIDLSNEKLNENSGDFDNKEISFISGSAGTTIYSKTDFFKSFLDYYSKSHILQYTIIKLEEKERILSGSDYIIFYWVKTFNPKSKRLLNKIKQTKQIQ